MDDLNQIESPFLNQKEVQRITGLSRSTILREIDSGRFPKAIRIAQRRQAWLKTDLQTWLDQKSFTNR
jgi:prophage regulatory protein